MPQRTSTSASQTKRPTMRRTALVVNLTLMIASILILAVVANYFSRQDGFRAQFDATKTRAYSLSPQTQRLLDTLDGSWTIAMVLNEDDADPATLRQIDEVLRRYAQSQADIAITRLDPTDPAALGEFERLIDQLRQRYLDDVQAYDAALDRGREAFEALRMFAQQQAGQLDVIVRRLAQDDPTRRPIVQRAGALGLLANEGELVTQEIDRARRMDGEQYIPEYDVARSILVQALSQWANELFEMSKLFRQWLQRTDIDPAVRTFAQRENGTYEQLAGDLIASADELRQLPAMELSDIGRQLGQGEAAIIIGPDGAAAIPASQLLPHNRMDQQRDMVTFDQRFRGEQIISSTMRSMLIDPMPRVIFVHAEAQSLMQNQAMDADLVGVRNILSVARYTVTEWIVGRMPRPDPVPGQRDVWVIVPPPPARGLQPQPGDVELRTITQELIEDGQPVLLSLYPSFLPKYGQVDAWAIVPTPFEIQPDTAHLILEREIGPEGKPQLQTSQRIIDMPADHPVARAVHGQWLRLPLAIPLKAIPTDDPQVTRIVLAEVNPDEARWIDRPWREMTDAEPPDDEALLAAPVPVVVASERPHPAGHGTQRMIVVGSGGWMVSNVADRVTPVGGNRVALNDPGNHELMLASVAWLAGLDELIAPSPTSQEVSRLTGLSPQVRARWKWIVLVVMPVGCLLLGLGVWLSRRF
jgi:hypothetical protein